MFHVIVIIILLTITCIIYCNYLAIVRENADVIPKGYFILLIGTGILALAFAIAFAIYCFYTIFYT